MSLSGPVDLIPMNINVEPKCGGKRVKGPSEPSNSDRPILTVITPVFNGDKDLESTIRSVLEHGNKNLEFIVIDGGSTDRTIEILRKYEDSIDYWVSEPDSGIYDAMNKGVRLARGQWLCFLGSDDTLCESSEKIARYLDDERTIYYGDVYMTGSKRIYDGAFGAWKLSRRNICQQAILYPHSLFESRMFDLRYPLLADWEFNLRSYSDSRFRFQHIPVIVANYNDVNGKSSVGVDEQFKLDQDRIIRECLPMASYTWYRFKRFAHAVIDRVKGRR
jgi:glycosyltransferase involved in cell wall biosynthesis